MRASLTKSLKFDSFSTELLTDRRVPVVMNSCVVEVEDAKIDFFYWFNLFSRTKGFLGFSIIPSSFILALMMSF